MRRRQWVLGMLAIALTLAGGCAPGATSFVRDDVDFSFIRTVAVYPFYNLTQDIHAGRRVRSIFISELLDQDAVAVLESGETMHALANLRLSADGELSAEQIKQLGEAIGADAVFFGTVEEYGLDRAGDGRTYAVTASFSLVETQTGTKVWNAQVRTDGGSIWRSIFGGGSDSQFDVSRAAVGKALGTLF